MLELDDKTAGVDVLDDCALPPLLEQPAVAAMATAAATPTSDRPLRMFKLVPVMSLSSFMAPVS
ncbi:hypothetical protein [Flexivirga caeni]|nr:hypothetical protein [Flexivirga caeni]